MFKITNPHAFTHTVSVQTPIDGDQFREDAFQARFKMLSSDALDAFDMSTDQGTKDFLRAAVLSTEDVIGEDDTPVAHSSDLLEQLIASYNVRIAMVNTYFKAVTKARLGN
jgi:hypothetical protein